MTHNLVLGCFESVWHYGGLLSFNSTATITLPAERACCSVPRPVAAAELSQPSSLQQLFAVLDEDGDGHLSLHEMRSLLAKLGINSTTHSEYTLLPLIHSTLNLNQTSSTHDDDLHSLDFPRFAQLYASLFTASSQDCPTQTPAHADASVDDELLDAFQLYDTNRDGFISAAELAAVLRELGLLPAHHHRGLDAHLGICQAYIESVDLDGNGMVDLQEFKAMLVHPDTSGHHCPDVQVSHSHAARLDKLLGRNKKRKMRGDNAQPSRSANS